MLKKTLLYFFLFLSLPVLSQVDSVNTSGLRYGRIRNFAAAAERQGDLYLALEYYKELVEAKPDNYKLQFHIADLYRLTKNYVEAEKHYRIVSDNALDKYPKSKIYLGMMMKCNGDPEGAREVLLEAKRIQRFIQDRDFKRLFRTELEGCDLAIALKDSGKIAVTEHLNDPVNSKHIDFSPIPMSDSKLVYGSLRVDEEQVYDGESLDSITLPTRKFYVAEKEGNWKFKGEWVGPFNSEDEDVANGTYSLDSSRFYFCRCSKNWQYKMVCKIYFSENNGKGWSEPVIMNEEINTPDFTSSHPTVGRESRRNQEVIYFVSDRPGGRGGMDIWYTEYNPRTQEFKKPRNCGGRINGVGDELTPYYNVKTKTLYYSTDSKPNIGGLDVYSATGEKNKWLDSRHMGLPINSEADDVDFVLLRSGKGGYLVSNRKGGNSLYHATCCDDIYSFTYNDYIDITLTGKILDLTTNECIDGPSKLNVYIVDGEDKFLAEQISLPDCNYKINLSPGFEYILEPVKEGYFTGKGEVSTVLIKESADLEKDVAIEPLPKDPIVLESINYEFNSAKLTKESVATLDSTLLVIMHDNPGLIIEIMSHTDSKGSDSYNMTLSQKRAESVVNYLLDHGISKARLTAQGYGETKPIEPNENPDGSDNPEGRRKNRRTEFRIVGTLDPTDPGYHPEDDED